MSTDQLTGAALDRAACEALGIEPPEWVAKAPNGKPILFSPPIPPAVDTAALRRKLPHWDPYNSDEAWAASEIKDALPGLFDRLEYLEAAERKIDGLQKRIANLERQLEEEKRSCGEL